MPCKSSSPLCIKIVLYLQKPYINRLFAFPLRFSNSHKTTISFKLSSISSQTPNKTLRPPKQSSLYSLSNIHPCSKSILTPAKTSHFIHPEVRRNLTGTSLPFPVLVKNKTISAGCSGIVISSWSDEKVTPRLGDAEIRLILRRTIIHIRRTRRIGCGGAQPRRQLETRSFSVKNFPGVRLQFQSAKRVSSSSCSSSLRRPEYGRACTCFPIDLHRVARPQFHENCHVALAEFRNSSYASTACTQIANSSRNVI